MGMEQKPMIWMIEERNSFGSEWCPVKMESSRFMARRWCALYGSGSGKYRVRRYQRV